MADNVLNNLVSNSIKDVLTETKPKSESVTGGIAQALSSFSAEKVKTKMDTINADFVEFGASSSDLTKVIGTHIGGGSSPDEAAVYGNLGNLLANNWAEISTTLEEFQNNFDKSLTLEMIAKQIMISPNHLCKYFKKAHVSSKNKMSCVGLGLAYDALRRFKRY